MPQMMNREEEMRKEKMIAEGGPVLSAYFNDITRMNTHKDEERMAEKTMVDEGGLGAEVYYKDEQKIANIDVAQTKDDYLN